MLRDPKVVQRNGEQERVSCDEFIHEHRCEKDGFSLLRTLLLRFSAVGEYRKRPRRGGHGIQADLTPCDHLVGIVLTPHSLDDVSNRAAH